MTVMDRSFGQRTTRWRDSRGLLITPEMVMKLSAVEIAKRMNEMIVMIKLVEEVGEIARALIGEWENREGRGDFLQESAQVSIVLASLVNIHNSTDDLRQAIHDEMTRLGA